MPLLSSAPRPFASPRSRRYHRTQPGLTLDLFDDALEDTEIEPTAEAFTPAIIAGCRCKLLTSRETSLRELRRGFSEHVDFSIQLGVVSLSFLYTCMAETSSLLWQVR